MTQSKFDVINLVDLLMHILDRDSHIKKPWKGTILEVTATKPWNCKSESYVNKKLWYLVFPSSMKAWQMAKFNLSRVRKWKLS